MSCNNNIYKIKTSDVEAARFFSLPKGLETIAGINDYKDILTYTSFIQDTIIYDRKSIEEYINFLNELKPKKSINNNFRIYSIIKLANNKGYMHLGFGENFDTKVGQQQMKDNPQLFEWLHKLLYTEPYQNIPKPMKIDSIDIE